MHSLIPNLLRRLRGDERGFILATSVIILLVLLLTMTAITLAASDNTTTSFRTGSSTQALAAAQAGEQIALFRVNNAPTSSGASSGNGTLGNGATYSYTVTSSLTSGSSCTGLYVSNSVKTVTQDCIASTGTAHGVSQTVEERVAGYVPQSLFPVAGIFAINGLTTTSNEPTGTFDMGTNGSSSLAGELETGKLEYPSGNAPHYNGSQNQCGNSNNPNCVPVAESSPIAWSAVSASLYQAAEQSNNDASINWSGCGSVTYTASTHVVGGSSNSCVFNIPSGTYYFCNISFSGSTTLDVTPPAYFYIDSPVDTSTSPNCPSGDGYFESGNQLVINNGPSNTGGASGVQIYIFGDPPCTTACPNYFNPNGSTLNAYVYAPYSLFSPANGTGTGFTMVGALVAASFQANGSLNFTYQAPTTALVGGSSQSTYYPTATAICPSSGGC